MLRTISPEPAGLSGPIAQAFEAAIAAAACYRGATAPNPPVGCVVLDRADAVLAVAAHRRPGERHAEAEALEICRRAGTTDRIETVVVTLEPCNHWGRTPPCTEAILATPARAVWIGASDPNPRVTGGGEARLREAGVEVHRLDVAGLGSETLSEACLGLVEPFVKYALTGRPWITIKQALDGAGSMIPPPGSTTFTSPAALTLAHTLRKRADAILTGSGTVLADDPAFTVRRIADHPGKRRVLTILDRRGRVPAAYLSAAAARGFQVDIGQDLGATLDRLGHLGVLEVLVEAGPSVTTSLLDAGLWDEHVVIRKGLGRDRDTATVRRPVGSSRVIPLEHEAKTV